MSKGQQIKLQLAFVLSYDAKVYIMDEPAGNLDVEFRKQFYETVRNLVKDGTCSVIYITHLVEEMEHITDYLLWIDEGRQRYYGTLEELLDRYRLYEADIADIRIDDKCQIVGQKMGSCHQEYLLWNGDASFPEKIREQSRRAKLAEIMYYEGEKKDVSKSENIN